MKLDRILCPIDYSDFSKAANYYATSLASATHAEIVYLHVVCTDYFGSVDSETEACRRELSKIQPFQPGIACSHIVRHGNNAAKEILDAAAEHQVDLIAMGTHGHTGAHRLLHGSVATAVLRSAPCPVLAVKLPVKQSAPHD